MQNQIKKNLKEVIFIILGLGILDQTIKIFLKKSLISFFYLCNPGIAFGFKLPPFLIIILNIVVLIYLIFYFQKKIKQKNYSLKKQFYLILILTGAISNLLDRILYGCVIDYIDLKIWPVFNLADFYISLGVGLLMIELFKDKSSTSK